MADRSKRPSERVSVRRTDDLLPSPERKNVRRTDDLMPSPERVNVRRTDDLVPSPERLETEHEDPWKDNPPQFKNASSFSVPARTNTTPSTPDTFSERPSHSDDQDSS